MQRNYEARQRNRKQREINYQELNSNDMMSAKAFVLFMNAIFQNTANFIEEMQEQRKQELIEKVREKMAKDKQEAIDFLKTDEFKAMNKNSKFNFDDKEVRAIERSIKNNSFRMQDILEQKDMKVSADKPQLQTSSNVRRQTIK